MITGNKKIGVIGNGFVGGAISYGFVSRGADVKVYDREPERSLDAIESVLSCDFVFVCLPTPMLSPEGGDADLSILIDFFEHAVSLEKLDPIYIIKSTVPVGTTEMISCLHKDLKVIHNPEFLTAANAREDFINSERTVLGGDDSLTSIVSDLYYAYFQEDLTVTMSSKASELVKYTANSFLALKVSYFNMVFEFARKNNINFGDVVSGACLDSRIGFSHTGVPGPDGDYGYGGTCFPKDINAMINMFGRSEVDNLILRSSWEYNKKIRKSWDWSNKPSAVSSEK